MHLLQIPNHQPLKSSAVVEHVKVNSFIIDSREKIRQQKKAQRFRLKAVIILNLAIPGSKSPTLIYQKTSNDICLAGVFVTGQVSQHLYLFLGMVDPELKTSTKPLVFTIVFYVQVILPIYSSSNEPSFHVLFWFAALNTTVSIYCYFPYANIKLLPQQI